MSNEGFKTTEVQNERVELIEGDAREADLEGFLISLIIIIIHCIFLIIIRNAMVIEYQ